MGTTVQYSTAYIYGLSRNALALWCNDRLVPRSGMTRICLHRDARHFYLLPQAAAKPSTYTCPDRSRLHGGHYLLKPRLGRGDAVAISGSWTGVSVSPAVGRPAPPHPSGSYLNATEKVGAWLAQCRKIKMICSRYRSHSSAIIPYRNEGVIMHLQ